MIEKFLDDALENNAIGFFNDLNVDRSEALKAFFDEAYKDYGFGEVLYNENAVSVTRIMGIRVFRKAYSQIIESFKLNGTFETYILLLKAIFGENAIVEFEKLAPAVLNIKVTPADYEYSNWVTKQGTNLVTKQGTNLVFRKIIFGLTDEELLDILKIIRPSGFVVTFEILR